MQRLPNHPGDVLEKRILIVDDDDTIRALLQTVLRRRGHRIDMARNGVEALEKLAQCRYALMILDLMMPRMSGYEVLEQVGRTPLPLRPQVLVLTAGLEGRKLDTSVVVGSLSKPFDIELLVDTVTGCLTVSSGQVQDDGCGAVLASNEPN